MKIWNLALKLYENYETYIESKLQILFHALS